MNTKPRISIVTPSYNQVRFLESCIKSVLAQDCPGVEYIVVDGQSTDGSIDIIREYEDKISKVIVEPDEGHGDAINKGFACSSGEIMGWLNSDDLYTPWALNAVCEIFDRFPHVQWIQGLQGVWNINGQLTSVHKNFKNQYDFLIGDYQWIQQESTFWRRTLWDKCGSSLDTNVSLMVDSELWSRFFVHANLYSVECVLAGFRLHGSNRSITYPQAVRSDMAKILEDMAFAATTMANSNGSFLSLCSFLRRFMFLQRFKGIRKKIAYIAWFGLGCKDNPPRYPLIKWSYIHNTWVEDVLKW